MNRTYKVIWSKARRCYVVVSELAKSQHKSSSKSEHISSNVHNVHGEYLGKAALAAVVASLLTIGGLAYSPVMAADKDIVEKGAQQIAYDISPANDGTNIAVGKNAKVFIGGGTQESMLSFGEKEVDPTMTTISVPILGPVTVQTGWNIHANDHAKQNLPEAIAVGTNSYARTGSIEIGAHTLGKNNIKIGDATVSLVPEKDANGNEKKDSEGNIIYKESLPQFGVGSTTLGTNSYTGGGFATTIGSYNVQSSPYEAKDSSDTLSNATKNAFATVIGTFNSNESLSSDDSTSGVANMISGTANKVTNSNGAIVMGAGNSVKNSIDSFDTSTYSSLFKSATDMQKALMKGVANSAGGATLVIGGANTAENTLKTQIIGVNNTVKVTKDTPSDYEYNMIDAFNTKVENASHLYTIGTNNNITDAKNTVLIGDDHKVSGLTDSIIIGDNRVKGDDKAEYGYFSNQKNIVSIGNKNVLDSTDGSISIGNNNFMWRSGGQPEKYGYDTGNIAIGNNTYINSYVNQGDSIVIGKNATVLNRTGTLEHAFAFGKNEGKDYSGSIAIGQNSYARSGSTMIGVHSYQGQIGDITVDFDKGKSEGTSGIGKYQESMDVTTIGNDSYNNGVFSTVVGSYTAVSGSYHSAKWAEDVYGMQNFGAAVLGSLNSVESVTSEGEAAISAGMADSILGSANRTHNANGTIMVGAGNVVEDSSKTFDVSEIQPQKGKDGQPTPNDLSKAMRESIKNANGGGAAAVVGNGNEVKKSTNVAVMGSKNTVTSTTNSQIFGDNRVVTGADGAPIDGAVIIGSADATTPLTTDKKNVTILGHNANATVDGGVALGAGSVASVDSGAVGYDLAKGDHSGDTTGVWKSKAAAVSVGQIVKNEQGQLDAEKTITRQITGVAAGSEDTDAVNVAQLKAISNTVDASKTKYYSVNDSAPGAIFDNEEFEKYYTNKNNDGAKSYYAMAAGYGTYAAGDASTVIGSYSVIQNDKVKEGDDESLSPQGATAVSVGSFNFNLNTPIQSANDFSKWYSGTANSIVGQGNLTKDSNGVLIYGAGNKITNSNRGDVPIDMLATSMNSDVYQNPESFIDKVGEAVLQSGGQVMAIGGGNVADKAYMTQLMGVGNKVQGADITFTPPELQNDEEDYERYITAFNRAFNTQATRLNYVDGFYNNLTNAKNDYIIGMANAISGDDVSSNKSNIVIGDFHQMKNGSNNIILGSQDGNLTQKRYNTDGKLATEESVNRFTHQENLEDAVMIGHNADVQKNGGVAIGSNSVASTDAFKETKTFGYDPKGEDHSEDTTGVWKSTAAAVSVGKAAVKDNDGNVTSEAITRQITNVAAGKEDTDAVNVAQLKAVSSTINTNIDASKMHFYSVNSTDPTAKNYKNDGASGEYALAAGVGAQAEADNSIAIGTNAWVNEGDGRVKGSGDIAIGNKAVIHNYVNQSGSIALGQNALIENTYGSTEKNFAFSQTTFTPEGPGFIPAYADKEATGIAIGRNSFARTGSLMVGTHMYKGAIADMDEVDGTNSDTLLNRDFNNINMTTLGTNSFNSGTFATVTGAYSATTAKNKKQNFAATVNGSLNSIESYKDAKDNSGVASSIVGTANRIANSNNTTILGAGNEVTNSLADITAPTEGGKSAKALQDTLKDQLQTDAKGAIVVSGVGNKVNSSHGVSVMGSRNAVNTTDNIQLFGDNREVTKANGSVIIGSADSTMTTSVANATIIGHNANVEKAGGVAIGANSIATVDKDVAGYDPNPTAGDNSADPKGTWKSTDAAVSVGKADGTMTRQITGVAAGTNATDAVNVAQLQKAMAGAKDGNDTLKSSTDALKLDGNKLSMNIQDTAGNTVSGSVDLSKFAQAVDTNTTYTLTGQENKDNTTTITLEDNNGKKNSVTVATKDTRNTVKAGENVTLDTKDNDDGSHEYTVNVKADGKVEAGSTKIVSGDAVYNETRVAKDGTFVKKANTAGENLSALDNQVTANAESIYHINNRVSNLDNRINKVGAGAAALAALHPLDFDPSDKWDFAVGYGNYRNANSVAFGAFYRPNEDTMFSLGTNFGNGENMFNAGLSFKIGQGSGITTSKTAMAKKIESLEDTVDKQDKKIAELEALVKEQGEMIRQYVGKK